MPASDGRRFALTSEPVLPMTASSLKRWGPEAPVERLRFSARSAPPKSRRSRSRTLVNPLAVTSAPHGQSDQSVSLSVGLPVLRFQYVARSVRVLVGSRWKLQQFQDKTLALRTGDKPSLLLFPPDSDATESRPDEMLPLPLDTMCQLTSSRAGSTLNGLKLSSHAADRSFRVRVRFATQADAAIWSRVVQDALRHARWSQRLEPLPLPSTGSPPPSSSRVRSRVEGAVHGPTRRQYVVKVLDQNDGLDCNEVRILKKLATAAALRSRALVGGYRVIETANDVRVVMPRLPGRSLLHFLHHGPRPSRMAEDEVKTLAIAICEQLQALHGAGVVHCDLKLENVVLADFLTARLIDFGGAYDLSTITDKHRHEPVDTTMVGTPGYIAPERILRPIDPPTPRADVFSLGVMLFQLLAGHHPFTDAARRHRPLQLADSLRLDWTKAQTLLLMRGVSSDARDLVRRMLVSDPMARISVDEILRSPWLAKQ